MNTKAMFVSGLLVLSGCSQLTTTSTFIINVIGKTNPDAFITLESNIVQLTESHYGICKRWDDGAIQCDYINESSISVWFNPKDQPLAQITVRSSDLGFWPVSKTKMASGEYVPKDHAAMEELIVSSLGNLKFVKADRSFSGFNISVDIMKSICPTCEK